MRKTLPLLIAAIFALFAISASAVPIASFVDRAAYSTDTVTQLDWLDVTLTQNQSMSSVLSGPYVASGWRYAGTNDVVGLFQRYVSESSGIYIPEGFDSAVQMARQLGVTLSWNNTEGAVAIMGGPTNGIMAGGLFIGNGIGVGQIVADFDHGFGRGSLQGWYAPPDVNILGGLSLFYYGSPYYGSFLVRQSITVNVVPEPSTPSLLLGALVLMGLVNLRRNSRPV